MNHSFFLLFVVIPCSSVSLHPLFLSHLSVLMYVLTLLIIYLCPGQKEGLLSRTKLFEKHTGNIRFSGFYGWDHFILTSKNDQHALNSFSRNLLYYCSKQGKQGFVIVIVISH